MHRVLAPLTGRVCELAERHAEPLRQLTAEVEELAAWVNKHLEKMGFSSMSKLSAPDDYARWLASLKSEIQGARARAALSVNQELVRLYHRIGVEVLDRQRRQAWGTKIIERLATDLREAPDDQPTIGLLLCKTKKRLVAEYALSGISKPMGVAEYQLVRALPEPLDTKLPTIEELEEGLSAALGEADDDAQ